MTTKEMFNYLVNLGFTKEGVAGLMGNLKAESNLNPKNLQNTFERKLGMTDVAYTKAVDDGNYKNFVRDSAGYGLAQWTFWSRKQNLLEFAKRKDTSIGNCKMQLEFLYKELQGYKEVFEVLKTTKSIKDASNIVLTQFEKPADQSEAVQRKRIEYSQSIYNECVDEKEESEVVTMGTKYEYDVAIDAGHGSKTAGKRTPNGYREHYINVKTSYYEEQYLEERGLKCLRVGWDDTNAKDDSDVSLSNRQKKIKNANCRIVTSNHANAHGTGNKYTSANGVETLIHAVASKRGDSRALAKAIQKQIVKGTEQTDRGVKEQVLAMCNCTAMGCEAAALTEIGFMTNKMEADLMKTDAFCKEQGEDIARGVLAYLGVEDKKVSSTTNKKPSTKKRIVDLAQGFKKTYDKTYTVNAEDGLNLRYVASAANKEDIIVKIPKGKKVTCYGYYTKNGSTTWLLVQYGNYTGFASKAYLK